MHFIIPFIGKTKSRYLDEGIQDYAERLQRYADADLPIIKSKISPNENGEVIKKAEAELLLDKCHQYKKKYMIALDPAGKGHSSEGLARLTHRLQERGHDTVIFLIGGHLGLHDTVLQHVDIKLSLSQLTFTHEMSRLILLEQLYRACTINAGHKYHN